MDYQYNLDIECPQTEGLDKAMEYLEKEGVYPGILGIDWRNNTPRHGNPSVSFSSDSDSSNYCSCWDAEDHEKILCELSRLVPAATVSLYGQDLDDPNNFSFKKEFQNGSWRAVEQEKQDLDELIKSTPWRVYGEAEQTLNEPADWREKLINASKALEEALAAITEAQNRGEKIHPSIINGLITTEQILAGIQDSAEMSPNENTGRKQPLSDKISAIEQSRGTQDVSPRKEMAKQGPVMD